MQFLQQLQQAFQPKFSAHKATVNDRKALRDAFANKKVMLFDVDTQRDFFNYSAERKGLPVEDANGIIPVLKRLTEIGEKLKMLMLATMDTHTPEDIEFETYEAISDEHCVRGTQGWEKLPETIPSGGQTLIDSELWDLAKNDNDLVTELPKKPEVLEGIAENRQFVLVKNTNDFAEFRFPMKDWPNPYLENAKAKKFMGMVKEMGYKTAVLYGVATDICVKKAADSLKALGIKPYVIEDGIKGVFSDDLNDATNADPDANQQSNAEAFDDVPTLTLAELENLIGAPLRM